MKLCVVTATTNLVRAQACIQSWGMPGRFVGVLNGRATPTFPAGAVGSELTRDWVVAEDYLGSVPAFRLGVDYALEQTNADIIACFHDDLEIQDEFWAASVIRYFARYPQMGLAGFGGALAIGHPQMYEQPYDPMSLARHHFRSNLVDAEKHGIRSLLAERVACLDGFSQIGRREFWEGIVRLSLNGKRHTSRIVDDRSSLRPWTILEELGLRHHIYDSALGALAARHGWEAWYLPIRCRHYGGQTAVGDPGYGDWAKTQHPDGDRGFWETGHRAVYDAFKDILPLRIPQ